MITHELSPDWKDPTTKVLKNFDLSQTDNRITLDGIGYDFEVATFTYKMSFQFSNPAIQPFVDLEKAFFQAAGQVSPNSEWQIGADYLSTWRKYIHVKRFGEARKPNIHMQVDCFAAKRAPRQK